MSTSVLVRGTLHQRHSRVPTNDATSSHRLHSIEREQDLDKIFEHFASSRPIKSENTPIDLFSEDSMGLGVLRTFEFRFYSFHFEFDHFPIVTAI